MSKSDLKAAMQLLQVNKPLRLAARAPSFAPPAPTLPNPTPVENSTQVEIPTSVELQTQVQNKTEVEKSTVVIIPTQVIDSAPVELVTPVLKTTEVAIPTPVQNKTPVVKQTEVVLDAPAVKPTQVENQTQAANETPVSKTTEVLIPTETQSDQITAVRRATEQDSSVVLEARACEGLEKGYTRLPNSVLMKMANGDLTRGEMKILLLIARFTISFQKKVAPLSKTVLERQSGLRGAGVLEALSGLVAKKMIVKVQGDQHKPNMLGLVLPADWDQMIGKSETSVANKAPVVNPTPVTKSTSGEVTKTTPAQVENPSPFKDIKIYSNKNSHSQPPEILQKYFSELKPAKKRESELKAFEELSRDYCAQDISDCFLIVRQRGVGAGAEPCHSPMAFLSKAIASVFVEVEERRKKQRERSGREESEAAAKRKQAEIEAREAAEWEIKEQAFNKAFSSEERQTEALADLCRGLPFKASTQAGRIFGIGKWWETLNEFERDELR